MHTQRIESLTSASQRCPCHGKRLTCKAHKPLYRRTHTATTIAITQKDVIKHPNLLLDACPHDKQSCKGTHSPVQCWNQMQHVPAGWPITVLQVQPGTKGMPVLRAHTRAWTDPAMLWTDERLARQMSSAKGAMNWPYSVQSAAAIIRSQCSAAHSSVECAQCCRIPHSKTSTARHVSEHCPAKCVRRSAFL